VRFKGPSKRKGFPGRRKRSGKINSQSLRRYLVERPPPSDEAVSEVGVDVKDKSRAIWGYEGGTPSLVGPKGRPGRGEEDVLCIHLGHY